MDNYPMVHTTRILEVHNLAATTTSNKRPASRLLSFYFDKIFISFLIWPKSHTGFLVVFFKSFSNNILIFLSYQINKNPSPF